MEENFELTEEKIQKWINDGKEQIIYSFDDWLNEKPFPDEFWLFDKEESINSGYEVLSDHAREIFKSLDWAWNFVLETEINYAKEDLKWMLYRIEDLEDKRLFLNEEKRILIEKIEKLNISKIDIYLKRSPPYLIDLINAKRFLRIKECHDNSTPGLLLGEIEDAYLKGIKNHSIIRFIELEIENLIDTKQEEKVEAYKNLPHALCILDDLGILDLIEEKFKNKNYLGKARETDKAKLIATILKIDNIETVRASLGKKDYLTAIAKKNAKKTLNDLGLTSSFDDD